MDPTANDTSSANHSSTCNGIDREEIGEMAAAESVASDTESGLAPAPFNKESEQNGSIETSNPTKKLDPDNNRPEEQTRNNLQETTADPHPNSNSKERAEQNKDNPSNSDTALGTEGKNYRCNLLYHTMCTPRRE